MTELHPVLEDLAGTSGPINPGVVDADLVRGRRALRARRRNALAGGTFALASVVALATVGLGGGTSAGHAPNLAAAPSAGSPVVATPHISFVAYTGAQPAGFRVDSVPQDWRVQGVSAYTLDITPPNLHTDLNDFQGKLVVMLESTDADLSDIPAGFSVSHTSVDGRPALLLKPGDGYGSLHWTDATGHRMDVQWPLDAGWSDAEMTQFAAGVHATSAAKAGRG
jgi:hypothetical protein